MKYIIAIGIFQALVAAVLLWRSRGRNHADDLLIALLVSICLHLSIKFFIYNFVSDIEILGMMNTFIWFCYLPILYLYTLKIIRPNFIPASRWYVFIPFMVGAIGFFSVASVLATSPMAGHRVLFWYNTISLYIMIPLDTLLACWIINQASKKMEKHSHERHLIVQLAYLFLSTSILGVIFLLLKPLGFDYNYISRSIIYTILILICLRIVTYRFSVFTNFSKQNIASNPDVNDNVYKASGKSIFNYNPIPATTLSLAAADPGTDGKSEPKFLNTFPAENRKELLSMEEMLSIVLKLETAMNNYAYYKDSELTLDKLSAHIEHNKYHISEALNHFLHKPFYTFVNEYRIEYVKHQINTLFKKDVEINMLSLAYDAGFNSKSSFNRYFKEIVGQTPTAYYRMISINTEILETP